MGLVLLNLSGTFEHLLQRGHSQLVEVDVVALKTMELHQFTLAKDLAQEV